MISPRTGVALASIVIAAVASGGCLGGSHGSKVGGNDQRHLTLVMQTPDAPDPDAEFFIDQVKERTDGRLRIVEGGSDYPSSDPDNEARLVRALRGGQEKLAYIPARAWERTSGITSFRALQAPFLVTDYTVLRRITMGPIARSMLRSLARIRLVGLGLVPNELRRPLGRKPLVSASAFRRARIRVVTSPTSVVALRALGAVPVTNFTSKEVGPALRSGRLDGVESSTKSILDNSYVAEARYLPSNLALFAKVQTIAIREDVFARLSAKQREALRAAAAATVAHADPAAHEAAEVQQLCTEGLDLVRANPADLAALRQRAERAYASLDHDPVVARFARSIRKFANEHENVSVLPRCSAAARSSGSAASPRFPQGRFASMLTEADFERAGARRDPNFPEPWVITIQGGHWRTNEQPRFGGRYIVRDDQITFVIDQPSDAAGERETVQWSYYRGKLNLRVVDVRDAGARVIYTAHPWRRLGRAPGKATAVRRAPRFPTGTFETRITRADLRRTGFPLSNAHWEDLTFTNDGRWRDLWFHPRRADQPPASGRYTVRGNVVTLTPANPDVLRWSYYRGLLTFQVISDPDAFGSFTYTVHPWRRIR